MKSVGKIVYAPTSHLLSSNNWAIVTCDDEISKYYRSLYLQEFKNKIIRPTWGAHISWIRNERIPNFKLGKLFNNKIIEFEYYPGVKDNGTYFWLNVKCDYLLELRSKYGLSKEPKFGLHLTIGKIIK